MPLSGACVTGTDAGVGRTMRGCFVTGTDTGVGKTILAAAIVAALRARGITTRPLKPVITGLDDPPDPDWPPDHDLLAAVSGIPAGRVAPRGYGPAVSPHLAAALAGELLSPAALRATVSDAAAGPEDALVIEGVGGLLVPLCPGYDVRALARDAGLPLVIAARPGLGTINHTLLTLEAARSAHLDVRAVVLTPWPEAPDRIARSNRETIAQLGEVEVEVLPTLPGADPAALATAGAALPLERWLDLQVSLPAYAG